MRRRDLLAGLSFVPLAAPAVAQCVLPGFPRINIPGRCEGSGVAPAALDLSFMTPGTLSPLLTFTRASTATYFDAAGVMQTAAINAPRWDYDPATLALRGLLLEDQRSNAVLRSGDLTVAGNWTTAGVSVVAGSDVAPINAQMMSRIAEVSAGGNHYVAQSALVVTSGQLHTLSCFAKAAQNRYFQIGLDDPANGGFATFDLQTGVVSQALATRGAGATIGTASIQAVGGGIYRCAISVGVPSATARVTLIMCNGPTPGFAPAYTGSASNGLSVWGVQVELGDFATSYIPTTSAAVTRSIDSCLIPPANMAGWFAPPGGSWFAEFVNFDATLPASQRIIGRPSVTASASPLYVHTSRLLGQFDGVQLVSANTVTANAITKAATTWAAGRATNCVNGGAVATLATLVTGYGALTTTGIYLMSAATAGANEAMAGYLRTVRYWPTILSDAEMQSITS
jgi:hypothetical protein